jgi:cell division septation protein DedD
VKPERAAPTAAELEAERLRKTLEAEMALNRTAPAEAPAGEPAPSSAAPGTRVRRRAEAEPSPAAASLPEPIEAAPATGSASASPQTPAAARAPAAAAAPAPTWIQVYSSTNGGNAQGLAARLRRGGFQVVVLEARSGGAVTYRVRVGPYPARAAADAAAARLRRDFRLDTWVTDQP